MILQKKIFTQNYSNSKQPRFTSTASEIGFIRLKEEDIIFSSAIGYSYQDINISETGSITAITNTSISSNSKYTYNLIQHLLSRSFIKNTMILTGSNTAYISTFKSLTSSDLINDNTFKLGNSSIIYIKKNKFGEAIKPMSFTANTSAGYVFYDCISANDTFGIIKENTTSLSAGIILYDLGVIFLHGPNVEALNSISALTSIQFYSSYNINTLNIFCTSKNGELNYTSNENAFYNNSVTTTPNDIVTKTVTTSSLTALNFNTGFVQFDESASSSFGLGSNDSDYTLETHVSASSLTSQMFIIFHGLGGVPSNGYYLGYDPSLGTNGLIRFQANLGAFSLALNDTVNVEQIRAAISANNISNTGLVNISVVKRGTVFTMYTSWVYSNTSNGTTGITIYSTSGASSFANTSVQNNKVYLGTSSNGIGIWKGLIDNVKIYKFALHLDDVLLHTYNPSSTSFPNTISGSDNLFTVNLQLNENKTLSGVDNFITNPASASITGYGMSGITAANNYFILSSSLTSTNALSSYSNSYQWGLSAALTSGKSNYYLAGLNNKTPYITGVGLYNDKNQLLAIGKLAQPIKKISTIPFTVRLSLDL